MAVVLLLFAIFGFVENSVLELLLVLFSGEPEELSSSSLIVVADGTDTVVDVD